MVNWEIQNALRLALALPNFRFKEVRRNKYFSTVPPRNCTVPRKRNGCRKWCNSPLQGGFYITDHGKRLGNGAFIPLYRKLKKPDKSCLPACDAEFKRSPREYSAQKRSFYEEANLWICASLHRKTKRTHC